MSLWAALLRACPGSGHRSAVATRDQGVDRQTSWAAVPWPLPSPRQSPSRRRHQYVAATNVWWSL